MHFALGISQLPQPTITRVTKERAPPGRIVLDDLKPFTRQPLDPITDGIAADTTTVKNPCAHQVDFRVL